MSGLVTTTSGSCLLQEQQRISIAKAGIVCRYGDWVGGWVCGWVWVGVGGCGRVVCVGECEWVCVGGQAGRGGWVGGCVWVGGWAGVCVGGWTGGCGWVGVGGWVVGGCAGVGGWVLCVGTCLCGCVCGWVGVWMGVCGCVCGWVLYMFLHINSSSGSLILRLF